ncbi:hypothetical protein H6F94_18830 [Leptolyngbya sp. FACHB-261]|nr:hypothetical protein [Leptolyngbya sp. FACHB-261]
MTQPEKYTDKKTHRTVNPGDVISEEPQSVEEKSKQLAVDSPDITGDHIKVPTYFVVDEPDGSQKALHHVKDADEISDLIRETYGDVAKEKAKEKE